MSDAAARKYIIHSDGGGQKENSAAAAAIIDGENGRDCYAVFLGGATNNEAEIFGGLLAFAALSRLESSYPERGPLEPRPGVRWHCDSEYVLKSATGYINTWQKNGWKTASKKPVKNQGLWQSYLQLSRNFAVKSAHVRGHSGHPENEACDGASTWLRKQGEELIAAGEALRRHEPAGVGFGPWTLIDGRELLTALRDPSDPDIAAVSLDSFLSAVASAESGSRFSPEEVAERKLQDLMSQLQTARDSAQRIDHPKAAELAGKLESILGK